MGRALFAALDNPGALRRALRAGTGRSAPAHRCRPTGLACRGRRDALSNIQTGTFAGPLGSPIGQHRHRPDLAVRTPQITRRLYTPCFGLAEAVLRASPDPACMLAFWLVGFEEQSPASSGEICVAELFGHAIGAGQSRVRIGVKAHNDPCLHDDIEEVTLDLDATEWHTYTAEWRPDRVCFFVDDQLVRTAYQRIDYPLQLMVDLFEFPADAARDTAAYPKIGEVKAVRGYAVDTA
jgi:Glycosyl hydrolases family 16